MSDFKLDIKYGAPTGLVPSLTMDELYRRPSTKMWMRMLSSGKWDRRKLKRIMRLAGEGR
jgi:hypothetical protein